MAEARFGFLKGFFRLQAIRYFLLELSHHKPQFRGPVFHSLLQFVVGLFESLLNPLALRDVRQGHHRAHDLPLAAPEGPGIQ